MEPLPAGARSTDELSVIVPFKDKAAMTLDCVRSLVRHAPGFREVLLVSNNSRPDELEAVRRGIEGIRGARVLVYDRPFNYQKLNNWAARQATGRLLFFLNNDTELLPESTEVVRRMADAALEPDVGITGCLLLYGDGQTIQHAGVFLKPKGQADHMYVGERLARARAADRDRARFPYEVDQDRRMTAVTGAAQIVEAHKFWSVGGFDERFILCGGDVDLCIRMAAASFQTRFVSGGHIIHKESQSRRFKPIPENDFYWSYRSYLTAFDLEAGDPHLPLLTAGEQYR